MTVDGALGTGNLFWIGHDVIDVLTFLQPLRDNTVIHVKGFPIQRCAFPRICKQSLVFGLSGAAAIVITYIVTRSRMFLWTAVAHKRCLEQMGAGSLPTLQNCCDVRSGGASPRMKRSLDLSGSVSRLPCRSSVSPDILRFLSGPPVTGACFSWDSLSLPLCGLLSGTFVPVLIQPLFSS